MIYVRIFMTLILAFITCLFLDRLICSQWANKKYTAHCDKALKRVPEEIQESVVQWLRSNLITSVDSDTSGREIISHIPLDLRYKLNEKKLRAYMRKLGYVPLSDCILDPAVYAVEVVKKEK